MALAAKLQLRQSQSLVMTPQLMQSIKLLQLTHLELERFVDEEIERNPLLERAEPQDDAASDQAAQAATSRGRIRRGLVRERRPAWSAEAMSEKLDTSLENVFPDDPGTARAARPRSRRAVEVGAAAGAPRRVRRGLRPRGPGGRAP